MRVCVRVRVRVRVCVHAGMNVRLLLGMHASAVIVCNPKLVIII